MNVCKNLLPEQFGLKLEVGLQFDDSILKEGDQEPAVGGPDTAHILTRGQYKSTCSELKRSPFQLN